MAQDIIDYTDIPYADNTGIDIPATHMPDEQQSGTYEQITNQLLSLFWLSIFTGIRICRRWLVPYSRKASGIAREEFIKIHRKQNWFKRCSVTLFDNATGLGIAMLAAKLIEDQVEVQQFSNLWGLLATRPVVSESTFEIISFMVEFVIALVVFTLVEHYQEEFRERKKHKQAK